MAPLLEVCAVSKAFPGVQALRDVDFVLQRGEVVALIGENGAGKSTLMRILAGLQRPDRGEIRMDGAVLAVQSPAEALAAGIALIHQELSLCENLTVAAALFLGAERRWGPFLRRGAMAVAARRILGSLGLAVEPAAPVATLGPGQRQLLEIARALRAEARVLIMDEPTSSLTHTEAARLFEVVRQLRGKGVGIVYISHRLGEVRALADRVVALRDGRNSGEVPVAAATHERMVSMMVGRPLAPAGRSCHAPGEVALRVRGLATAAFPQAKVDLEVRRHEVVGIAGLLGSGRSELLRAIFGADRAVAGDVEVAGRRLVRHGTMAAVLAGLVLAPEDRKRQGLVMPMSVAHNLSLPTLRRRGAWIDRRHERDLCQRTMAELGIAATSGDQAVGSLSGGNQQKVVLGKWLAASPDVLLLDEPTRGVDVGARAEIHARLHELAGRGLAILFVSSELEEVMALADRVVVMHRGRVAGELPRARLCEADIMLLATAQGER